MPGEGRRFRVAVVVPAYNEAASISRVLQRFPPDSPQATFRTFVCDDGSTDATCEAAAAAGATVVRHDRNRGIGASLTTALERARAWGPDIYVELSADGQDDPSLIRPLLDPILRGEADYVVGSRFLTGAVGMAPVRRVGVRFYSRLVQALGGLRVSDVTSGMRAFRADVYDCVTVRSERNWAIEMTLRAGLNRLRVAEVSTPYLPRMTGTSQFSLRRLFLIYHFRAIFQVLRAYTAPRPGRARPSRVGAAVPTPAEPRPAEAAEAHSRPLRGAPMAQARVAFLGRYPPHPHEQETHPLGDSSVEPPV